MLGRKDAWYNHCNDESTSEDFDDEYEESVFNAGFDAAIAQVKKEINILIEEWKSQNRYLRQMHLLKERLDLDTNWRMKE